MVNKDYSFQPIDFDPFAGNEIEKIALTNEPQRELWLSCMLGGDEASLAYNESVSLELTGNFNAEDFRKAIEDLVQRHEALRASLSKNGESLIISKTIKPDIYINDLSGIAEDERRNHLQVFVRNEMGRPFDLYNGPLFRFFVHKLDEQIHYFTLIIHHLVGDGWSLGIILEDLSKLYNAYAKQENPRLPAAEQISDYAAQQLVFHESEEYKITTDFWLDQYKDGAPVLNMPLDFNRPPVRTYQGKRNDYVLDEQLLIGIKQLSAKAGSSLVATLITAFEVFLYHRTGQQDIVLGLPSAGQSATGNFGLVGHCVNLLPLKSSVKPDMPFFDYLKKRKSEIYDAYDHQQLTFSELLKRLNLKRDRAQVPLVPVVFNVDMGMDEKVAFHGLRHRLISNPRVSQTFEISLNVNGSKNAMIFEWAYNTQLFKSETIDRMMLEFELLLKAVSENPQIPVRNAITYTNPFPEFSPYSCSFPKDKTIIDLFKEQVKNNPDQTAVLFEGRKLTYFELHTLSNQLAGYLIHRGVKPDTLVALCVRPSLEMLVGLLGILKSGAAYVPVDPEFPAQRINFMIAETTADVIVSDQQTALTLRHAATNKEVINLDDSSHVVWEMPKELPAVSISTKSLMYVIYTSGSTGNPKGVMIEHGSLVDYLFGLKAHVPVIEQCRSYALGSSIATDLGNTILFSALSLGAELHLFAKDRFNDTAYIHAYFARHRIDCLKIVPSHWKYLSEAGKGLFPQKLLMFGGETLPAVFIKEICASHASCLIVNHYGPTETTIGKLLHIVNKNADYTGTVPIGRPFSNTLVYVLSKDLKYCPIGVPGELHIGGAGLSRGYLNNEELTNRSFISDPFGKKDTLIYKTGDLVRWLPDGHIEYLGRMDDQVKIRGNRIELGEIQNVLQKHPEVKQCAIIVDDQTGHEKRLVGYIVVNNEFHKEEIISHLKASLPEYMVPRILIRITEIPLTPNGKVDRKALPKPDDQQEGKHDQFVPPGTEEEKFIAKIWTESLGLEQVSITDDFFELGGHSLIAVKVMNAIEKKTGKRLPLASLFDNPTVKKLAELLHQDEKVKWDSLVAIKPQGRKIPLYLVHGGGLNVLLFRNIAKYMDDDQPVYALQALGLNGEATLLYTIEEIAEKYNSEILKINPAGPFLLAGYSLGGKIAYEMARQLINMGKEVRMLGIFDTYAGSSVTGADKFKQKVVRQFKKVPFIANSFIKNPQESLSYQLFIARYKMKQLFSSKPLIGDDFFTYDSEINRSYETAYQNYQLAPLDITIDLFRVNKRLYYLDDRIYLGWKNFAKKGIKVHEVPGDHKTFLFEPHDQFFARILQEAVNKNNNNVLT